MNEAKLEIKLVTTGYRDIVVVRKVTLTVTAGSIYLLLGRNGAGKTTLLHATAGLLPLVEGEVWVSGTRIDRTSPDQRVKAGLALVQAEKRIFRQLTVEENLRLGYYVKRRDSRGYKEALEAAYSRFPDLVRMRATQSGRLSGGQQQMLAIAQALMPGPSVVMLDEPTAGLAPAIVGRLLASISELKREGKAILLVEQAVAAALPVADHVGVLTHGELALSMPAADITDVSAIQELYLGTRSEVSPNGAPSHAELRAQPTERSGGDE
jgi:branched-chain amino acid transport system ATP-binding protein